LTRGPKEATELTIDVADVGGIKVTIDVEISGASVLLTPHRVSQFTQAIQIIRGEKSHAVFEREALAGINLGANIV
jgi:hypothetical protein